MKTNFFKKKQMRTERWHQFNSLYEENKERIVMKPSDTYPINHENLTKWFNTMMKSTNGFHQIFAMMFRQELQHINFATFYEHLLRSASEIVNHCIENRRFLILMVEDASLKSPTWVSMLIWPIIKEVTVDVTESVTLDLYNAANRIPLFVDDVSYSGAKLYEYTANIRDHDLPFWVCLGAMSKTARYMFRKSWILIPTHVMEFDTLWSKIDHHLSKKYDTSDMKIGFDQIVEAFYGFEEMHTIYFDHKLADAFSTAQYLLATGYLPNDQPPIGPFIKRCTPADYIPTSEDGMYNFDFKWENVCPKPFYKFAGLTYRGVPFSTETTIFELFDDECV
jgi:hypothetical protein